MCRRASEQVPDVPTVFRYVTENQACHEVASRKVSTPSATLSDRHAIAPATRPEQQLPVVRYRRPADRRARPQCWRTAIAELPALQTEYASWYEALPDSLRDSATAETLREIIELDLDALAAIVPPRG